MTLKKLKNSPLLFIISLMLLVAFAPILTAQEQKEQWQVIPGELPDPSVIKVDNTYYATGTSGDWAPHYPIYSSTDLKNWKLISHVFNETPDWTMSSFWAPELFHKNGTFFCYYTARATDGISKVGVATTRDISKGFEDKGPLISWGNEAIDAFVYEQHGTLYITWKAYGLTPDKPIQLLGSKLSDDGLSLVGSDFVILTANEDDWERGGIEGQSIVERGGYLYMLYSGNNCCGVDCDYMVGVARAKQMEGPWDKYDANPLMTGNNSWKCPGHGTVVDTGDGWYYLYHAYHTEGFPILGRAAVLSEMYWDETTGWPYFKVDEQTTDGKRLTKNISDDFNSGHLENWWRLNVKSSTPDLEFTKEELKLTEIVSDSSNSTGAVLCIVPDGPDFSFSTHLKKRSKARKGLVLFTNENNSMGLGVEGDSLVLWQVMKGSYSVLNKMAIKNAHDIWLRANVEDASKISFQYGSGSGDWSSIKDRNSGAEEVSGQSLAWWSSGMMAGLQVRSDPASGDNEAFFAAFKVQY